MIIKVSKSGQHSWNSSDADLGLSMILSASKGKVLIPALGMAVRLTYSEPIFPRLYHITNF